MKNIVCLPKSYFLALMLLIGISLNSYAQSQSTREKIESMRVAYITNKINLSTEEAQTLLTFIMLTKPKCSNCAKKPTSATCNAKKPN